MLAEKWVQNANHLGYNDPKLDIQQVKCFHMSELVGKTIGKFEVESELGGGGMAEVFRAYQPSLNRYVAIKVIHRFLSREAEFLTRFRLEAQNVASLRHPNIVQVYDFDVFEDRPYMVMEYVDGPTLGQLMVERQANGGPWSLSQVLKVIQDVGQALAYAHKQAMIHRDVKPANVMCDPDGRYILTDFGLAKMLSGPSFTATGTVLGTPAYMSPEQCQGQAGDVGTDIYSLGIVLYELATGQLPFEADSQLGYIMKHVNEPPRPPNDVRPDLPDWLNAIILKTLAKDVGDRYLTVDALLDDLQHRRTPMVVSPVPPAPPAQPEKLAVKPAVAPLPAKPAPAPEKKEKGKGFRSRLKKISLPDVKLPDVKLPDVSIDSLREKAESAAAALEERQDKLSARGLEATERMRQGLQSKLEQAVSRTEAAQRAEYTILYIRTGDQLDGSVQAQLAAAVKQYDVQIAQQTNDTLIALFELGESRVEAPVQAIECGLSLIQAAATTESALAGLKLQIGVHTGVLPTHEAAGEAVDIAAAVAEASLPRTMMASHATYSRVRRHYQFDKQPSIRQPGTSTPVQIYLVSAA